MSRRAAAVSRIFWNIYLICSSDAYYTSWYHYIYLPKKDYYIAGKLGCEVFRNLEVAVGKKTSLGKQWLVTKADCETNARVDATIVFSFIFPE